MNPKCERCKHECPGHPCEKCASDPMSEGDRLCVACDRLHTLGIDHLCLVLKPWQARSKVAAELMRLGASTVSVSDFEISTCSEPTCCGLYRNAETGEIERCDECAHSAGIQEIWTDEAAAAFVESVTRSIT